MACGVGYIFFWHSKTTALSWIITTSPFCPHKANKWNKNTNIAVSFYVTLFLTANVKQIKDERHCQEMLTLSIRRYCFVDRFHSGPLGLGSGSQVRAAEAVWKEAYWLYKLHFQFHSAPCCLSVATDAANLIVYYFFFLLLVSLGDQTHNGII